ncbi:MAG: response regulator [Rhodobacterales bacterium]|nr:response regulator [Rhodobacterales bacterium]
MLIKKPGLYGSLVVNLIPPFVAFSATIGMLLAWLYTSSMVGGHSWISSANQNTVPQIFEMLDVAGVRCFSSVAASPEAPCLGTNKEGTGAVHAIYLNDSTSHYLDGKRLDTTAFNALMDVEEGNSGFAVINDRVVHVVARPNTQDQLVLLSDVTAILAQRLAAAGAVEAELYSVDDSKLLGATWTGLSNEKIVQVSPPPGPDVRWHTAVLDGPYGGYDATEDESVVFSKGKLSFSNFARSFEAPSVPSLPAVRSVIYVPSAVMLSYTHVAIVFFLIVTVVGLGLSLFLIRRLTHRHIEPIIDLSSRVRKLRERIGGQDPEHSGPYGVPNAEVGELSFAIDRLEQKLLENAKLQQKMQQHERLESIGRLTGGIAHDFNNLLNIVLANCSFLTEDVDDDDQLLESVRDIESAARSAAEMTRGLLAFSSGRASEIVDGRNVASEVLTTAHLIGRTLGPETSLDVDVEDSVALAIPAAQLQQILMNLILNARDATRGDSVKIRLGLHESKVAPPHRPDEDPSGWLLLTVQDDGVGMDEATVSQIFDPFFSSKGVGLAPSTGLGLSVVYGLVDGTGGSIEVASQPDQGTTFSVFLPKATVQQAKRKDLPSAAGLKGLSVFLVEDDHRVRKAVTALLERLGMKVTGFDCGADIVASLNGPEARAVDLLVTDIRMPGMDGYEVVSHCRSILHDVPVMFMTGYDPEAQNRQVPENSALVIKPMGFEEFMTAASELHRTVGNALQPLVSK